ncbi:hypothetical protein Tco_0609080 [Tanacetum coccineum]
MLCADALIVTGFNVSRSLDDVPPKSTDTPYPPVGYDVSTLLLRTTTYEEYELSNIMTRDLKEPWLDNADHKWYDELANGKLKEETLMHKAKVEESWGNATPGVMKFCAWVKNTFDYFHKLDYNVLVKLQECWWKINAHEVTPFTRLESYG